MTHLRSIQRQRVGYPRRRRRAVARGSHLTCWTNRNNAIASVMPAVPTRETMSNLVQVKFAVQLTGGDEAVPKSRIGLAVSHVLRVAAIH